MFFVLGVGMFLLVYFLLKQHVEESTPTRSSTQPKATREKPLWFKKEEGKFLFDKRGNEVEVSQPVVLNPGNYVVKFQESGTYKVFQVQGEKVRGAQLVEVVPPDMIKNALQRKRLL